MTDDRPRPPPTPSPARAAVLLIGAAVVIAAILGVATGTINDKTLRMPTPSPTDPITLP